MYVETLNPMNIILFYSLAKALYIETTLNNWTSESSVDHVYTVLPDSGFEQEKKIRQLYYR